MPQPADLNIRPATAHDVPTILSLIKELAEYEHLSHEVIATQESLTDALFGPRRAGEALIAEMAGEPAGYALFFHSISTFLGRAGIYLEDLYVRPNLRGQGIGRALLKRVAQIAVDRRCGRLEWSVLNWNEPAIRFYRSLGAAPLEEWTMYRLTGDALRRVADRDRE